MTRMLPEEKNKKTLSILNMMRSRGVPAQEVSPFPGEQESATEDLDDGAAGEVVTPASALVLPKPPRKKNGTTPTTADRG